MNHGRAWNAFTGSLVGLAFVEGGCAHGKDDQTTHTGYTFAPASRAVTVSGADVAGHDFMAASATVFADDFES